MASPAALEGTSIHVIDEHALIQKTVRDIDFAGLFIEIEGGDTRREDRGLLVILFHLRSRHFRSAMPEIRDEFAVLRELDDAVAARGAGEIDIQISIHADRLQAP